MPKKEKIPYMQNPILGSDEDEEAAKPRKGKKKPKQKKAKDPDEEEFDRWFKKQPIGETPQHKKSNDLFGGSSGNSTQGATRPGSQASSKNSKSQFGQDPSRIHKLTATDDPDKRNLRRTDFKTEEQEVKQLK